MQKKKKKKESKKKNSYNVRFIQMELKTKKS